MDDGCFAILRPFYQCSIHVLKRKAVCNVIWFAVGKVSGLFTNRRLKHLKVTIFYYI